MSRSLPIFLRAHTIHKPVERGRKNKQNSNAKRNRVRRRDFDPKWPQDVLVLDCETTKDASQGLTFGSYRYCRSSQEGLYQCIEEGLFYADDLPERDPAAVSKLKSYVSSHHGDTPRGYPDLRVVSRSEFIQRKFWPAILDAKAMVVCFNAPFDLSRLAVDCRIARRKNEGWSFVMSEDTDPHSGLKREDPFRPRVKITPKDSKSAFIKLTGVGIKSKKSGERLKCFNAGRFLDLKTLGWALRSEPFSLKSACEHFGVEGKLDHQSTGGISFEEIEYCRQDVRATTALLNAMRADFDLHPIDLKPDQAYSPASIAKAYLWAMNIIHPREKFKLPDWVHGVAMQSYYGGRAECRIRHTEIPIVLTDVMSEYPTVNVKMNLWKMLTAKNLRLEDATAEIKQLLAAFTPEMLSNDEYWPELCFFALVRPSGDIFPVRTTYNGANTNIGINPLTSETSIWYAGPDIVAATLLSGKAPEIISALRVIPECQQKGLRPVRLRGQIQIDPRKQDFFKSVIEARATAKHDEALNEAEREGLAYFLKILASSGAYGLFVEVNPTQAPKGEREHVDVFSGQSEFSTTSETVEPHGRWYFPIFGSLITAAGRLILALIEYSVTNRGGTYLFCDTDSMAIVASETGGLVPCKGGPFRLPDGREAVKALTCEEVREVQKEIDQLNPYDRTLVSDPLLKIKKVNCVNGVQRQIFGYAIAAKRYVLYSRTENGINIVSAKAHGLGFLHAPKRGFDKEAGAPDWVVEAWKWILDKLQGDVEQQSPSWFGLPAMMRCTITTPEVLKALQASQAKVPYPVRAGKPFNFVMVPLLDDDGQPIDAHRDKFTLITPFESDSSQWLDLSYLNIHETNTGKMQKPRIYRLGRPGRRLPSEALAQTYGEVVSRYRWRPEAKSSGPDGHRCDARTQGLLSRVPVIASSFGYIGKETNRRWEQGEDISILDSKVTEYRPNETARLGTDQNLVHDIRRVSIRALARKAGVSETTVKAARRGDRLQKAMLARLRKAMNSLLVRDERLSAN